MRKLCQWSTMGPIWLNTFDIKVWVSKSPKPTRRNKFTSAANWLAITSTGSSSSDVWSLGVSSASSLSSEWKPWLRFLLMPQLWVFAATAFWDALCRRSSRSITRIVVDIIIHIVTLLKAWLTIGIGELWLFFIWRVMARLILVIHFCQLRMVYQLWVIPNYENVLIINEKNNLSVVLTGILGPFSLGPSVDLCWSCSLPWLGWPLTPGSVG